MTNRAGWIKIEAEKEKNGKNETKITEVNTYSNAINIVEKYMYYLDENEDGNIQVYKIKINGQDKQAM